MKKASLLVFFAALDELLVNQQASLLLVTHLKFSFKMSKIVLTVRLIKSFEYRTFKNMILKDIDASATTTAVLQAMILESKRWSDFRLSVIDS
jgi:hypothetical protein